MSQILTTREQALDLALRAIVVETIDNPPIKPYSNDSYLPSPHIAAALAALNGEYSTELTISSAPRPGQAWSEQGGIYAGIIAGEDGYPDYHLIHASAEHEIVGINWADAKDEKTADVINGFNDWSLPNRREARLLTINSPASFNKDGLYWTSEKYAHDPDYAWMQNFNDGIQVNYRKSNEYRARAVRRLIIQ